MMKKRRTAWMRRMRYGINYFHRHSVYEIIMVRIMVLTREDDVSVDELLYL